MTDDATTSLTFYAATRPLTVDEIMAKTPQEPCECCGTPVTVLTVQFPDEPGPDVKVVMELGKVDERTGRLQQHNPERCQAGRQERTE